VRRALAVIVAAIALGLVWGIPGPVVAQESTLTTVTGRVEHGLSDPGFDPTGVSVTLNVLEGVSTFDQVSTNPKPDGSFEFAVVDAPSRTYFFGAEYQSARYSATRASGGLGDPVVITVFDATHDTSVLDFESYTVIVTGAVPNEGWIEVMERASVRNDSGLTLVPDFAAEGPAMLSFIRFALPPGTFNLDVRSSIAGGDVLEVDRGFALTTPIVPSGEEPHEFEFVYRLNYEQDSVDLSRTMRFGTETLHFVAPADTGRPASPRLADLGAAEFGDRFLRLLEGRDIEPGESVLLTITGLPMPSLWSRLGNVAGDRYVIYGAPGLVVAAILALLALPLLKRRVALHIDPAASLGERHRALLQSARDLESRLREGNVSERRYAAERAELKQALVDVRVRANLGDEEPRPH
jgi:hypothetical protein